MGHAARRKALLETGLLHPSPEAVTASLFVGSNPFFFVHDKVQVKYELLRAHEVEGVSISKASQIHGYSRAAFYLIASAFEEKGMLGLLDERRGRRGPVKVTPEIIAYLESADPVWSGADLVVEIERRFGVQLHRRTVERLRR